MNRVGLKACDTMAEWVGYEDYPDTYFTHGAGLVADRMSTAELFAAHSEATIALCGPLRDDKRERWQEALRTVCEALGKRVDGAYSRGMR